jgi:hypothetical protein
MTDSESLVDELLLLHFVDHGDGEILVGQAGPTRQILDQVTLPRERIRPGENRTGQKRDKKRARNRALLGPRWFRRNQGNSFGMNGGDDETRTRDLCRDSLQPSLWCLEP